MATKTTSTKPQVKKSTPRKKKATGASILKYLPESMEHIEIVKQVAGVLEDMKGRVGDVKHEASKELSKLMKLYEGNYKTLEKKLHKATKEAKQQAQVSMIHLLQKWHEHKEKLPAPLAKEIEKLITTIGSKAVQKTTAAPKTKPASAPKKKSTAGTKPRVQAKTGE